MRSMMKRIKRLGYGLVRLLVYTFIIASICYTISVNVHNSSLHLEYWKWYINMLPITLIYFCMKSLHQQLKYSVSYPVGTAVLEKEKTEDNEEIEGKKNMILEINAVHEAGHAVVAFLSGFHFSATISLSISYLTIKENTMLMDADTLRKSIMVDYAGMIAEKLILGNASSGSYGSEQSDIFQAARKIENYILITRDDLSKYPNDPEVKTEATELSQRIYKETQVLLKKNIAILKEMFEQFKLREQWTYEEIKYVMEHETPKEEKYEIKRD